MYGVKKKKPRPVHTVTKTHRKQDSRRTGKNERDGRKNAKLNDRSQSPIDEGQFNIHRNP